MVATVRSSLGSSGPGGSGLTAMDAVRDLKAKALISVGVAFAMSDDQPIGQLLLSEQLANYELAKLTATPDGSSVEVRRGGSDHCSPLLLGRYRDAHLEDIGVDVEPGLVLSGEKLVDYYPFREKLGAAYPEAIGGEMEGCGILSTAIREQVHWIVAKAVCDYGHDKGRRKVQRQKVAAGVSARAITHLLQIGALNGLTQQPI